MYKKERLVLMCWIVFFLFTVTDCVHITNTKVPVSEHSAVIFPLSGDLTDRNAEVSSMAWYKDELIIMPQYPNWNNPDGDAYLYAISKENIIAFLESKSHSPLAPHKIPFFSSGIDKKIEGFQGYEAIVFTDDRLFMTVEAETDEGMSGYLIKGEVEPGLRAIHLDSTTVVKIFPQTDIDNMAYETLVAMNDRVIALYEVNGQSINPKPEAKLFDLFLNPLSSIPLQYLEYRITDATVVDNNDRFWVINYFWPGDSVLKPTVDPLVEKYGEGLTHTRFDGVERLVELQFTDSGISLAGTPPVQLEIRADGRSRNWEGIVRLDDRGFLLATDKYPETILAFVPFETRKNVKGH